MSSTSGNTRRAFLQKLGTVAAAAAAAPAIAQNPTGTTAPAFADDRAYWVRQLRRVAEPVLANMAINKLKERMPVEAGGGTVNSRRQFTHLEALGRTLTGIAPWLDVTGASGVEAEALVGVGDLARRSIVNATDPGAPDFINFTAGAQNLVDAAFLCHGLLRAPRELWGKLDPVVQKRLISSMMTTRKFKPGANNWMLFSAMIEAFLAAVGADWKPEPIQAALDSHQQWYKGDGVYGDGPDFHWDYYNSFVIQPMLIDILEQINKVTHRWSSMLPKIVTRARRYAAIQERLIAPDGTYPIIGRSIAYRCGAFQLLGQMALRNELPDHVTPAQVRSGLSAVLHRTLDAPDTFDANGWLQIGVAGHQPGLAESYISTGSLYLCSAVFLPLGLPPTHAFWSGPPADWTARQVWSGKDARADHAIVRV